MKAAWVYFILCQPAHLYVGVANDPLARFDLHCKGRGAMALRLRRPIALLGAVDYPTRREALQAEYRIKRLRTAVKWTLACLAADDPAWVDFAVPRGWRPFLFGSSGTDVFGSVGQKTIASPPSCKFPSR